MLWRFCVAEVRSRSVASPASPVPCTVSSGSRGPTGSRPGVLLVFSVGRLAHLIVEAVSAATDSIDMFLGDGVCSSYLLMLFLA